MTTSSNQSDFESKIAPVNRVLLCVASLIIMFINTFFYRWHSSLHLQLVCTLCKYLLEHKTTAMTTATPTAAMHCVVIRVKREKWNQGFFSFRLHWAYQLWRQNDLKIQRFQTEIILPVLLIFCVCLASSVCQPVSNENQFYEQIKICSFFFLLKLWYKLFTI